MYTCEYEHTYVYVCMYVCVRVSVPPLIPLTRGRAARTQFFSSKNALTRPEVAKAPCDGADKTSKQYFLGKYQFFVYFLIVFQTLWHYFQCKCPIP